MPPHLNQTYRPGDQVMINYGPHNNITLYSEYGFLLSDNADDHLPLHLRDLVDVAAQFLGKQVLAFQTQVCSLISILNLGLLRKRHKNGCRYEYFTSIRKGFNQFLLITIK